MPPFSLCTKLLELSYQLDSLHNWLTTHSMARANLKKSKYFSTSTTGHSIKVHTTYPRGPESASIEIPPFRPTFTYLVNLPLIVNNIKQDLQFLKIVWSDVWKEGFQLMQILGLLCMYFDAVVVEVEKYLLFFILALAILW